MSHLDDLFRDQPERMHPRHVGEVLGVSERTVVRWLVSSDFPGYKLPGGGWLVLRDELLDFMRAAHNQQGIDQDRGETRGD